MKYPEIKAIAALSLLLSCGMTSCDDNDQWKDVDGSAPKLDLTAEHLRIEAGQTIHIAGQITDADGISSIKLVCHPLNLNKTIDIIDIYGEPLTTYDLDYKFLVQETETAESFEIEVTVTDIGGRQDTGTVLVTLDADYTPPIFTASPDKDITVLIKEQTLFNLKFTIEDNRGVDYVTVDLPGVEGFPMRIEAGGEKKFEFAQKLPLPSKTAVLQCTLTAYDKPAQNDEVRSASISSRVTVSQLPDFEKVYLADVENAEDLNSDIFGVPILVDHIASYTYRARYYNEKAGTKICFIPQKTDFSPICFGPDPENTSVLGDDPETVGRITLNEAGVYYLIDFNTKTGEYSTSTYSIDEAIDPVMHLHYGSDDLNTWWETNPDNMDGIWWQEFYFGPASDPKNVIKMTQDSQNPHIYILEDWRLTAGQELEFMIHNWHHDGWWNFASWRCNQSSEPEKWEFYGNYHPDTPHYQNNKDYFDWKYGDVPDFDLESWGSEDYRKQFVPDIKCSMTVAKGGSYKLIFDAHTERAKLVPMN